MTQQALRMGMPEDTSQTSFQHLRIKHPRFTYLGHEITHLDGSLEMTWSFELAPNILFRPSMHFQPPEGQALIIPDNSTLEHLAFHIGMIELISYWKCACPPEIIIKPYLLPPWAAAFWKNLFYLGLGEFRFLNKIHLTADELFHIHCDGSDLPPFKTDVFPKRALLPLGGGKDSAVSLGLLEKYHPELQLIPFMVNPDPASLRVLAALGRDEQQGIRVHRKMDPNLLALNKQGYLNGHTPFSALLAFTAHAAASFTSCSHIILSNEASANEATIPGTDINHQYSKSYDFENGFSQYLRLISQSPIDYFSLLRPLDELQIAAIFSRQTLFHPAFRSCNVGSKQDLWCGKCPKCLFVALMLAPFLENQALKAIFGHDILDDPDLIGVLDDLAGWSAHKPFECVGTTEEVKQALGLAVRCREVGSLPFLLGYAREKEEIHSRFYQPSIKGELYEQHHVPKIYADSLLKELDEAISYHARYFHT